MHTKIAFQFLSLGLTQPFVSGNARQNLYRTPVPQQKLKLFEGLKKNGFCHAVMQESWYPCVSRQAAEKEEEEEEETEEEEEEK